ncbi:MAG TPA: hypothetical protein HA282_05485 [Nanoarchaeota archaeon]|nr:MAG: fanconi anemia group M protein [archaeon GW2011_AR6]MBS3082537.1 hypothetical protein [Candidatus Pacearchaeota archaeon]HIH33915.1 hypothetical protein [Nanoarchaeota archaeon]HIH51120.1 hypothetical protein [Nanoarchaeota archaeon]HIH66634.1 hypothetical protein [Nanoarchaeota archaeon]
MDPQSAEIIVDQREKNSLVAHELIHLGARIKFERLPVADYLIGNIAVERKTTSDFISSMINKRLLRQLEEIQQYEKRLLVIEGKFDREFNKNAIRGMVLSTMLDFSVPVVFTNDYDETAEVLFAIAKRVARGKQEFGLKVKKKTYSLAEQQQLLVEGLPSIGPNLAKALLKEFKTITALVNASLEDLQKVEKIGKKKAEIIKRILEEEYFPRDF